MPGPCGKLDIALYILRRIGSAVVDAPAVDPTNPVHGAVVVAPRDNLGVGAGPSLADDLTLHGGELADILRIIRNGVSGKPMNAWADKLSPETIARVAAYVLGLKGTRPTSANPNDRRSLM